MLYTEEADRKRLARDVMSTIAEQNETATSIPALAGATAKIAMKTTANFESGAIERKLASGA